MVANTGMFAFYPGKPAVNAPGRKLSPLHMSVSAHPRQHGYSTGRHELHE